MKINWRVRFSNKTWLVGFVSQILIVAQMVVVAGHMAGLWQFSWSEQINSWALGFVNAVLLGLSMLGVVQDPTTAGYSDSAQARTYNKPRDDLK